MCVPNSPSDRHLSPRHAHGSISLHLTRLSLSLILALYLSLFAASLYFLSSSVFWSNSNTAIYRQWSSVTLPKISGIFRNLAAWVGLNKGWPTSGSEQKKLVLQPGQNTSMVACWLSHMSLPTQPRYTSSIQPRCLFLNKTSHVS
jgi:hypothetical protein